MTNRRAGEEGASGGHAHAGDGGAIGARSDCGGVRRVATRERYPTIANETGPAGAGGCGRRRRRAPRRAQRTAQMTSAPRDAMRHAGEK